MDSTLVYTPDTLVKIVATDSLKTDSLFFNYTGYSSKPDSLMKSGIDRRVIESSTNQIGWELMKHNPYFNFSAPLKEIATASIKKFTGKEILFYTIVALFVIVGILKRAFPKYFSDLFRLFFRTTLKQKQIREQLIQTPLPSLLLNGFYIVSGAMYVSLLAAHYNLSVDANFWWLFLYASIGLSSVYLVKYLGLKLAGWVFNLKELSDSYLFIVFFVNKMIGILLLPFLLLIAFSVSKVYSAAIFLSLCMVCILLFYRFILSFAVVRHQMSVNPFHFFLYLCAFEIAPLFVIYKSLLLFFNISS